MDNIFSWIFCLLMLFLFISYSALEKRIRSRYKEHGITAELPFNRAKVLILGDEGAGKTSTRKRLCGEGFHENMPRTEGIEITNVTYNWKKVKSSDDDFEKVASYVTIDEHFRTENEKTKFDLVLFLKRYICLYLYSWLIRPTVFDVLLLPSIGIDKPIDSMRVDLLLSVLPILAYHYFDDCIESGGFSFPRIFTHLLIVIFAPMIANTTFYGPLLRQVTYNVFVLFLYDGIFVSLASNMFVLSRGILLGLVLLAHQVEHQQPLPNYDEASEKEVSELLNMRVVYMSIFYFIVELFRRVLGHYFSTKIAYTIYLMVCMSLIIVIKTKIVFDLNLEHTGVLLIFLYMHVWMYTHVIQFNPLGHSLNVFSRMSHVWLYLGGGLTIGVVLVFSGAYLFMIDLNIKTLEFVLSILVFMCLETYIWKQRETDIPMSHLNGAAAAYKFGSCSLDKRWIICDFAGQQIYYDTHHLFIPRQGVFLVVFDASEFIANGFEDFRGLVERVQFWVQSVAIHADKENSVIFVIGTHKNLLNYDQLRRLSKTLEDKLYPQYNGILMFNKSTKMMVFFIENKDDADQENAYLRMAIGEEAAKLPFVKKEWPIRYHLFQRIISSKRRLNEYVFKKSSLREDIVKHCKLASQKETVKASMKEENSDQEMNKVEVGGEREEEEEEVEQKEEREREGEEEGRKAEEGELEGKREDDGQQEGERKGEREDENRIKEKVHNILTFFNRSGDIFYEPTGVNDDEEYVIIGLQILVDVVRVLVNVPPRDERGRHMAEQWHIIEEQGIVNKQFLTHIFRQHNIEEKYVEMMIDVLIRKEILFVYDEDKFRLLCKLPECEVSKVEPTGKVIVLYATFKIFRAEYVFLHLLPRLDNIQHDKTYRHAAEFKESSKCRYVVRVRKTTEREGPNFKIFESDVLKILIKYEDCFSALGVAFKIKAEIEQVFDSTRGRSKENENLLDFGHLCMECGALLAMSLDQSREVLTTVPDIFHTVKVTKEKVTITCSALGKEKED